MSRRAEEAHDEAEEGARKRGRLALGNVDFDATFEEFGHSTKTFDRRENLALTTMKRYAFAEGQLIEFSNQWLAHQRARSEASEVGLPEDWEEANKSSYSFPREFFLNPAVVCCRPKVDYARSDVLHANDNVETPVTQTTANGRLRHCVAAYRRLRPNVDINPTFLQNAYAFLRSEKIVKRFQLQPNKEKEKEWATNALKSHTMSEGRLPFLAYKSLLLFAVARPADLTLGQGRHDPQYCLLYKDESFFLRAGTDGKVRLGLTVTLENRKGYKNSQDDWVEVTMMSRPHMPLATDTVQLFAIMSIEDEVFEDVTSLEELSGKGITLDDLDPVMERLDIGIIREGKLELNVFRKIERSSTGGQWDTSPTEPATASSFRRLLYKVRIFVLLDPAPLRLPTLRHGRNAPRRRHR